MITYIISLIDNGIIINHVDFSLTNRNVTCDAIINGSTIEEVLNDPVKMRYCIGNYDNDEDEYAAHGTAVASIVGGKTYGVAKNVNIHMIAVDDTIESRVTALYI